MRPPDFERISIAIAITAPLTEQLCSINEPIRQFRWAKTENLHLSLRQIGEVDLPLREQIAKTLRQINVESFILEIEGLGIFPNRGQPQVIYAGVGKAHPRLFQLYGRVEETLARLGLPLQLKTFFPHITLARVSGASFNSVREFVKRHKGFSASAFRVEGFELYRTQYTHQGAIYSPIEHFKLRNQKSQSG